MNLMNIISMNDYVCKIQNNSKCFLILYFLYFRLLFNKYKFYKKRVAFIMKI